MENTEPSTNSNLKETAVQQPVGSYNSRLLVVVVIGVLLTALAAGLVVYFWQKSANEKVVSNLEQKVTSLEKQVSMMQKIEITPEPTSLPVPSLTPTTEPTANWKTYINSEYSFTVKYPQTFKTQVLAAGAGNKEAPQNARNFYIYDPENEEPYLNRYINFEVSGLESTYSKEWIRTQTTIGSISAIKLVNSAASSKFDVYLVELDSSQGVIEIYVSNSEDREATANQILSTFQFTK